MTAAWRCHRAPKWSHGAPSRPILAHGAKKPGFLLRPNPVRNMAVTYSACAGPVEKRQHATYARRWNVVASPTASKFDEKQALSIRRGAMAATN